MLCHGPMQFLPLSGNLALTSKFKYPAKIKVLMTAKICILAAIVTVAFLISGCAQNEPGLGSEPRLGSAISLKIGETAKIASDDITISLKDVKDSRCAEGAQCVWQGEASAHFAISIDGKKEQLELKLQAGNEGLSFKEVRGYVFRLKGVKPYPSLDRETEQSDYSAEMTVSKA